MQILLDAILRSVRYPLAKVCVTLLLGIEREDNCTGVGPVEKILGSRQDLFRKLCLSSMELKPQQLERLPLFKKTLRRPQTTRVAAAAQRARRQPRSSWRAVMLALGPPNGIRRCRRRGAQSYNVEGATADRDDQRLERCAEAYLR